MVTQSYEFIKHFVAEFINKRIKKTVNFIQRINHKLYKAKWECESNTSL